jgi:hypothetical protein
MYTKKLFAIIVVFLIALSLVTGVLMRKSGTQNTAPLQASIPNISVTQTVIIPNDKPATLSAKITPGTTALDLLRTQTKIVTQGEGTQAFVTKIGSREVDPKRREFWSFEVNGKEASVGAGSYLLRNGDSIVWLLKNY